MNKFLKINENDNVAVALCDIEKGYTENGITALSDIPAGHKILLCDLPEGSDIIKYSTPIGHLVSDCKKGEYIHEHNLKTNLNDVKEHNFTSPLDYNYLEGGGEITAYRRKNGKIGIRNEIWIIPTVGCVNKTVRKLESLASKQDFSCCDGVIAYEHPYGCSQMAEDQELTRKTLAALINHPNAGGVLVVSLGCENSDFESIKKYLGEYDKKRIKLLVCQDSYDEIAEGEKLISDIYNEIKNDNRESVPVNKLIVGFKCGASDAFSGITANAVCGKLNDKLNSYGASTILTEVPEMFGAEQYLMQRSVSREVFNKQVNMINSFKDYFNRYNLVCYENPSPGNHRGGITTLEEKSLGCIQKGGTSPVCDVLGFAEPCVNKGLNLLYGPGNDIVSITNLTAAGAQLIIFTTGRGTPLGAPVPTVKMSSNTPLFNNKPSWIDINAGDILSGVSLDDKAEELFELIIETANGKKTKNEIAENREIAIFKNGVTM